MKMNPVQWLALLFSGGIAGSGILHPVGIANQSLAQTLTNRLVFQQSPKSRSGMPGNLIGRGSRGSEGDLCGKTASPLTALVDNVPKPKTEKSPDSHRVLGLTMEATPTFWFYVPYQPQGNLSGSFEIREIVNGKPKIFHRQTISLPSTPGLFSVPLKGRSLLPGQPYQWVLSVTCNPKSPSANDSVKGWIEYENRSEVQRELQQARTPEQKILIYARHGIWHETMTTLVRDLCPRDRKQAQAWFGDLMQSIGFPEIATKPQPPVLQNCPKL